jgi:hypothetical protein
MCNTMYHPGSCAYNPAFSFGTGGVLGTRSRNLQCNLVKVANSEMTRCRFMQGLLLETYVCDVIYRVKNCIISWQSVKTVTGEE